MSDQNLLNQLRNAIIQNTENVSQSNFQLLTQPVFFHDILIEEEVNPAIRQIISQIPTWSDSNDFTASDNQFQQAYRQILRRVETDIASLNLHIRVLKDHLIRLEHELAFIKEDAQTNYDVQRINGGSFFETHFSSLSFWMNNSHTGKIFQERINEKSSQLELLHNQFIVLIHAHIEDPRIASSLEALMFPTADPASALAPRGWVKTQNQDGQFQFEPEYKTGASINSQAIVNQLRNQPETGFSFEIAASRQVEQHPQSWASGAVTTANLAWEAHINGSWQQLSIDETDPELKASISVEGITAVHFDKNDWYSPDLLTNLANDSSGGFSIGFPFAAFGDDPNISTFGQFGLLPGRVAGFVIVSQPKISLTLSPSTFASIKERIDESFGFRFGPMQVAFTESNSFDRLRTTINGNTIEMSGNITRPIIIGVIVDFPGQNSVANTVSTVDANTMNRSSKVVENESVTPVPATETSTSTPEISTPNDANNSPEVVRPGRSFLASLLGRIRGLFSNK